MQEKLLTEVAKLCDVVVIISNSEKDWVERSCRTYLPFTFETIQEIQMAKKDKFQILSAKHVFQNDFPGQPGLWKRMAFKWFAERFRLSSLSFTNLVVVGDRDHEIKAAEYIASLLENCLLKTIKYPCRKESMITPINLATRTKFLLTNFKVLVSSNKPYKWRINSDNRLLSSEDCKGSEERTGSKSGECLTNGPKPMSNRTDGKQLSR
jgi:hypothetical protein